MSGSIGGVDASIPLSAGRIGQVTGNSLASDPSKLVETMRGINDLRLFPGRQELQQQEIQQRGNQLQLFPGQQQQQQLELQHGAIANELAQQQVRDYKNKQVAAGLIPFFTKENPTLADATNALGQLQVGGNDVSDITAGLKVSGATEGQALQNAMRTLVVRAFPDAGKPDINYHDNGNSLIPINTNPIAGPLGQMGRPIPKGPTIAEMNALTPDVNQDTGATTNVPRVSAAPMVGAGVGGVSGGALAGPQMSPIPAQATSPSPIGGSAPGPMSVQAPSPATLGVPGAIGPAKQTALGETGLTSAKTFHDISMAGDASRSQDALLSTMQAEAQNFRPGPGADTAMAAKRFLLGFGAQIGTTFGIDEKKLAAQESVDKIANQLADAMGAGSDARLRVNQGANPSSHNTPAGLDLILRQLRGNTDYLKARQQLAADYPDKDKVQTFLAKVAGNLDPRAFQYNRLSLAQRPDYFKGISDKDEFKSAYKWAEDHKVLGAVQ